MLFFQFLLAYTLCYDSVNFHNFKPCSINNTISLINCTLINARSLKRELADLHFIMYNSNVHIIIITESWLHDGITDGLLDPQSLFNVLKSDRTHVHVVYAYSYLIVCRLLLLILIYCLISSLTLTQSSSTIAYIKLILYVLNLFLSFE